MDRKRHHKQPIVEKFVTNPLHDFKPGIFIPTFRLYGLDKATDEATVTCYDETEYVERKPGNKKDFKMGCEIRLSECSLKAVTIRHQGERRLENTLNDITRQRHLTLKESDMERQRIEHENTMKVKRKTIPLKDLQIPGWRFRDNTCICKNFDSKLCPVHWDKVEEKKPLLPKPKSVSSKYSFIVDTISDDDDDFTFYGGVSSSSSKANQTSTKPKTSHKSISSEKHLSRPKTSVLSTRKRTVSFKT